MIRRGPDRADPRCPYFDTYDVALAPSAGPTAASAPTEKSRDADEFQRVWPLKVVAWALARGLKVVAWALARGRRRVMPQSRAEARATNGIPCPPTAQAGRGVAYFQRPHPFQPSSKYSAEQVAAIYLGVPDALLISLGGGISESAFQSVLLLSAGMPVSLNSQTQPRCLTLDWRGVKVTCSSPVGPCRARAVSSPQPGSTCD